MTSHNLAIVFGPTLFRMQENENLLTNQGQINVFIDILIDEFYQIFPDEPSEAGFDDKPDGMSDEMEDGDRTEDELDSEDGKCSDDIMWYCFTFLFCSAPVLFVSYDIFCFIL